MGIQSLAASSGTTRGSLAVRTSHADRGFIALTPMLGSSPSMTEGELPRTRLSVNTGSLPVITGLDPVIFRRTPVSGLPTRSRPPTTLVRRNPSSAGAHP
jgi:hypothetical protein